MTSLATQLRELQKRYDDVCTEFGKQQGAVWRLEGEVKSLAARAERAESMAAEATQLYGKLLGYQQRTREEDAKSLGKLWHEANDTSLYGGIR